MPSAGVVCVAGKRALLLRRSESVDKPGLWAFPGGGIDEGETAEVAAMRELFEEAGLQIESVKPVCEAEDFSLFLHTCDEFQPTLNDEHDGYVWVSIDALPAPLHPGTEEMLMKAMPSAMAKDTLAFDKSVRSYDHFGRLRVEMANISKANVCEYIGSEIPDFEELGLDPKKMYKLFRDPDELKKAAATFNGIPLLDTHIASTAWDHPFGKVVGTTGTDATFNTPYLQNSLFVWTTNAIQGIETDEQRELSPAYGYRADMTPGKFEGETYHGVMRGLIGNHVALVMEGRTGSDVIVGDSKPCLNPTSFFQNVFINHQPESNPMTTKVMSKKAVLAKGALMASVKLAADKKLDLNTLLADVTHANWAASKTKILAAIKPVLAADANIEGVVKLLDHLDAEEEVEQVLADPEMEEVVTPAVDGDPAEEILSFLQGKLSDEDLAAIAEKLSSMAAPAEPVAPVAPVTPPAAKEKPAEDEPPHTPGTPEAPGKEEFVSKGAMDSAVRLASGDATKRAMKTFNAIRDAEREIAPYVGALTMAFDSAENVYKAALEVLSVDVKDVHPSAYRAVLLAQQKSSDVQPRLATDSAQPEGLAQRFPGATDLRKV